MKNPERVKELRIAWKLKNPDKVSATGAAYYIANSTKIKTNVAIYQAANCARMRRLRNIWRAKHPELRAIENSNRRARVAEVGGNLTKGLLGRLFKLQKGKCPCCGMPLGENYHLDHRIPLAMGGANEDWNMQILRAECNLSKGAKDPIVFMRSRGFLV